jgi:phosphoribosylglycinamide formyltransferase 1
MTNIAILASHNGSGFNAIYKATLEKHLDLKIQVVISNNTNAKVLETAKRYNIDNFVVNSKTDENPDDKIYTLLKEYNCKYVFLSGYMKKLSPQITNNFKVINSHPSLLPKYGGAGMYGHFVHEAVIQNNETVSGVSIHEVNEVYDSGKIIFQKKIDLEKNETAQSLEKKIKDLEQIAIVDGLKICLN